MIRQLNSKDEYFGRYIEEIILIHKKVLSWSVLSVFGLDFLRFYYKNVLKTKSFFCKAYEHNGKIVGFITCSVNSRKIIFGILREYPLIFPYLIMKSIIKNPKNLRYVVSSFFFVLFKQKKILPRIQSEIIAFAVLPQYKATGVARELFVSAVKELDRLGIKESKAMVVNKEDSRKFYSKCGQLADTSLKIFGVDTLIYKLLVNEILENPKINF